MDADQMAAPAGQATTASQEVFNTAELLEMVFLQLSQQDVLRARLVSRRFNHTIQGSHDLGLMLGVTMPPNNAALLWNFSGPPASITKASHLATTGQYEAPSNTQQGYGGHVFQVYEPNKAFFTSPSAGAPTPPPGFQPLNGYQGLCFKIATLLDQERLHRNFYREMQTSQGRLLDTIGSMRWSSAALPTPPTELGAALLSHAFITSPPCNRALVKWLVKLQDVQGKEWWQLETRRMGNANGLKVRSVAGALETMKQNLAGANIIEWELQVVPEYGIFPTEQEKHLVS